MKRILKWLLFIWFILNIFNAPIRYYLYKFGISWLIYISDVILIVMIGYGLLMIIRSMRISRLFLFIIVIILFSTFIGFVNQLRFLQILFGIKVFLPLLAGLVVTKYNIIQHKHFISIYRIFIPIIIIGLVLEHIQVIPWKGFSYNLGGFTIEGNRAWTTFGIPRLSGFQRASFETAIILFFLDMFYLLNIYIRKTKIKIKWVLYDALLFVLSIIGIIYTTSKTIYLAEGTLIIISVILILWSKVNDKVFRRLILVTVKLILFFLLLFAVIPPVISFVLPDYINDIILSDNYFTKLLFTSYIDRMVSTWPDAYSLNNYTYFSLFGRGIGAIGAPQKYFESNLYNPGDNIFVYLNLTFGWIVLLFLIFWIIIHLIKINMNHSKDISLIFFLLSVFSIGATLNGLESSTFALSIGMLLSNYYEIPFHNNENDRRLGFHV
ncbi:hypothetical protein [Tepidibacillus sp. LV47]|uniref:hypothetical protein n=1 Tax=Tepidibacillus sp. LV47 TaxID=3398228 RepID=UPI003AAD6B8E